MSLHPEEDHGRVRKDLRRVSLYGIFGFDRRNGSPDRHLGDGLFRPLVAELNWNEPTPRTFPGESLGSHKVLTILAILAGPILVMTIVMILVFEIKDVWDRNHLK
jgi:hypothetical protein